MWGQEIEEIVSRNIIHHRNHFPPFRAQQIVVTHGKSPSDMPPTQAWNFD
jgi:hypothetical protein